MKPSARFLSGTLLLVVASNLFSETTRHRSLPVEDSRALSPRLHALIATTKPAPIRRSIALRKSEAVENFASPPLGFEPNRGQINPAVSFLAHGRGYAIL